MTNHELCVDVVARVLAQDPQLPGVDVRAERVVAELERIGLIHHGRRIASVDRQGAAQWL